MSEFHMAKCEEILYNLNLQMVESKVEFDIIKGRIRGFEVAILEVECMRKEFIAHHEELNI